MILCPPQPPVNGGLDASIPLACEGLGVSIPPVSGGIKGGKVCIGLQGEILKSIEDLKPGDLVFSHDGKPHKILRTYHRRYKGKIIGIKPECSEEILYLTADHCILTQRRVKQLSNRGQWSAILPEHFTVARSLRNEATFPERKLWHFLCKEQTGVKFRRQHPIGPYIADFYARQAGLVIEVDGKESHKEKDQIAYDHDRDLFMQNLGLTVLRFPAKEIIARPDAVVKRIVEYAKEFILAEDNTKQWRYAKNIKIGDTIFMGTELIPCLINNVDYFETDEEVFDLEVEDIHSFLTSTAAVHNCGSGAALAVAE